MLACMVPAEYQYGRKHVGVVPVIKHFGHPADLLPASVTQFSQRVLRFPDTSAAKSAQDCSVSSQRARNSASLGEIQSFSGVSPREPIHDHGTPPCRPTASYRRSRASTVLPASFSSGKTFTPSASATALSV